MEGYISSPDLDEPQDEHEFEDSAPEPKPKKRKSRLEQLGIMKPEKRELTEEERKKADALAAEFREFSMPEKSKDLWKGLDSGSAFRKRRGDIGDKSEISLFKLSNF